ncbi:hypothetical protein B0H63DRAFT_560712 [Podospora didyma]|uniref:Uncharacterized protein n=1 Tax=Podospora didyma TaxID=330526 RepID=A0AAE0NG50_9PEZI|nr:hypothetical protein B0H63DRAFT_560712 [Podospora didyma]
MESAFEMLKVRISKPPTIQPAAPHIWKKVEQKAGEESLLGNTVSPLPLHMRIGLHGATYLTQMKQPIDTIATLPTEAFTHFINSILDPLPPSLSSTLVNAHGFYDDIPLLAAITRHLYQVALSLLRYGAKVDELAHSTGALAGSA